MERHTIGLGRLMRESNDRVEAALTSSDDSERLVAQRVLANPSIWQQWENEHAGLMRRLANCSARRTQVAALKQTTLRLLHGKALFQYLRQCEVRGTRRERLIAHFRPGRGYETAIIAEHGEYLRKACSYLCTSHLGADVIGDFGFLDPLQHYEELFTEYFELYCNALLGENHSASQQALLPLLKRQLHEQRLAVLDPRGAQPFLRREAQLRRPTGDTQRLPALKPPPRR